MKNNVFAERLLKIKQALSEIENKPDEFKNQLEALSYEEICVLNDDEDFLETLKRDSERVIRNRHAIKDDEHRMVQRLADEKRCQTQAVAIGMVGWLPILGASVIRNVPGGRALVGDSETDKWNTLAEDFYFGRGGKIMDLVNACKCYEEVIKLDPKHTKALAILGDFHHHGKAGLKIDYQKASEFYRRAYAAEPKKLKKMLKELQRDKVLASMSCGENINLLDSENNSALHRAAQSKNLKICARLVKMGASKKIQGKDGILPFIHLNPTEQDKVTKLGDQLSELLMHLKDSPASMFASRIFYNNGGHNIERTKAQLETWYGNDAIRPLLDLAKLAVLGLHDLSGRKKFADEDYDSDEDVDEKLENGMDYRLTIRIDPNSRLVDSITHFGPDGLDGKNASGVYFHSNTIYIGGEGKPDEVRGTLIHELTHFIALEVFKNDCKPYSKNDAVNKARFTEITRQLKVLAKANAPDLDPILKRAFSSNYEKHDQVHEELIVRVSEILVTYFPHGAAKLETSPPVKALWDYYRNVFLVAVIRHAEKLENRALNGWQKDLLHPDEDKGRHHLSMSPQELVADASPKLLAPHSRMIGGHVGEHQVSEKSLAELEDFSSLQI